MQSEGSPSLPPPTAWMVWLITEGGALQQEKHASKHITWRLFGFATLSGITCAPVKVLVVDDDAVAHGGKVQAVSVAVRAALSIHLGLAGGRQRGL